MLWDESLTEDRHKTKTKNIQTTLTNRDKEEGEKRNAPNTERVEHEDIDLALTMLSMEKTDEFRVVSYEKGYLSGRVKVLFPKSKPKNAPQKGKGLAGNH